MSFSDQVSVLLPRDLDSRLSLREFSAVNEWLLHSAKPFHIMRDHFYHSQPIVGGMWGVRLDDPVVRAKCREAWERASQGPLMWAKRTSKGGDQALLKK